MKGNKWILPIILLVGVVFAEVSVIPTDESQDMPKLAYQFVWRVATYDQWVRTGVIDPDLANPYGERPILWIASGPERGNFVFSDTVPSTEEFSWHRDPSFDIDAVPKSYSVAVAGWHSIAILKSTITDEMGQQVTWELPYFREIFNSLAGDADDWVEVVPDSDADFNWNARLLVIPAFISTADDPTYYIRQEAERYPELADAIRDFLSRGGTIYAEGNAGYLLEALGIIPTGTVDLSDPVDGVPSEGMIAGVSVEDSSHPLG
ncbi:MAG TPA: hypothetical protein ENG11_05320, partial [candidate division Zixibacteria bacterium]|nr:hypothetical protein [candidate division Zixibacteria bacterium]